MLTRQEFEQARGRPVYGSDGDKIGDVDELFYDQDTREPEWLGIGTGIVGQKRLLVPVRRAELKDGRISVPYTADRVKATPEIEGGEISQETERALYAHYGLEYSERRSDTGLPEGTRERGRAPSRGRARGGRDRKRRDEPTRDELYEEARRLDIEGRSKMDKRQLARAIEKERGRTTGNERTSKAKANPIEVQKFLEGVRYPTGKSDLVSQAKRQGASEKVRSTLERLPDKRFQEATDVSEEIGKLR